MINLVIQALAREKAISLEKLSELTEIPLNTIQRYIVIQNITEPVAEDLKKIAKALDVPVMKLIQAKVERKAFKFKILEIAEAKNLTIQNLSDISGIHPTILAFYSTQPMYQEKVQELEDKHQYLKKITDILQCKIEDLQVESEIPATKLRVQEFMEEKGLDAESLMMLLDIPHEFLDLIINQPVNWSTFTNESSNSLVMSTNKIVFKKPCDWLPCFICGCPK